MVVGAALGGQRVSIGLAAVRRSRVTMVGGHGRQSVPGSTLTAQIWALWAPYGPRRAASTKCRCPGGWRSGTCVGVAETAAAVRWRDFTGLILSQ
jgi:hypothetical protein